MGFVPSAACSGECSAGNIATGGFLFGAFGNGGTYIAPALVQLGTFSTYVGSLPTVAPITIRPEIAFLLIVQKSPTNDIAQIGGGFSGTFAYNPTSSTLAWTPHTPVITLGDVSYHLITDADGTIHVDAPTAGVGQSRFTAVNAFITVSPEPGTLFLLAPALGGLYAAVESRKRRKRLT
jgi:hypothetical protein